MSCHFLSRTRLPRIGSIALCGLLWASTSANAQLVPTSQGTNTTVTKGGSPEVLNILGGERGGNNLFHQFDQFDVSEGQTANFLVPPDIQAVLNRIGGGPSQIDGQLQVTGSSADLYLINPAGILFGPNAQLNLFGNFTATTATSTAFGDRWWNLTEQPGQPVDYGDFIGLPTGFTFTNSGAIVNFGDLSVTSDQSISLFGTSLLNAGTITAPGRDITLIATEPRQILRLNLPNRLLSLEVDPQSVGQAAIAPPTLGALLTGSTLPDAEQLTITPDGTVLLTRTGSILASSATGEPANCLACAITTGTLDTTSDFATGGTINLFGDQVGILDATLTANGRTGGGQLRIGGDYQGQPTAPTAQQTYVDEHSFIDASAIAQGNGGEIYVWSEANTQFHGSLSARGGQQFGDGGFAEISGKQSLSYTGEVNLSAPQGNSGSLLFDPSTITIKNGSGIDTPSSPNIFNNSGNANVPFVLYEENLESITASNLILEASQDVIVEDLLDNDLTLPNGISLEIRADADADGTGGFIMNSRTGAGADTISGAGEVSISGAFIETGSIVRDSSGGIVLTAQNNISTATLSNRDGSIEISSATGSIDTSNGLIEGNRNLSLTAQENISTGPIINQIGNIELVSTAGSINTQSGAIEGNRNLSITAQNDISTAAIRNQNGNIELISTAGSINTQSGAIEGNRNLSITAQNDISTAAIRNQNGNISVEASFGNLSTESIDNSGGNISLSAFGSLQVTGSFLGNDSSPVSVQADNGRTVSISHGSTSSFIVGDAAVNGTASRISNQETVLENVEVPGSYSQGSIEILTDAPSLPLIPLTSDPPDTPDIPDTPDSPDIPDVPDILDVLDSPDIPHSVSVLESNVANSAGESVLTSSLSIADSFVEASSQSTNSATGALGEAANETRSLPIDDSLLTPSEDEAIASIAEAFVNIERTTGEKFSNYLKLSEDEIISEVATLYQAQETLREAKQNINFNAALVYVYFTPQTEQLEVVLVSPDGVPLMHRHHSVTRDQVETVARAFRYEATSQFSNDYLSSAQQLHSWFLGPLQAELREQNIEHLSFVLDDGLRSLPVAALHDGTRFIIEDYSVGLMPTFSLTNFGLSQQTNGQRQSNAVLAMGASEYVQQRPLPAVEAELSFIAKALGQSAAFLNEAFTVDNFTRQLAAKQPDIVHLATHAKFESGDLDNSYIQFWDDKVKLSELDRVGLSNAEIGMIILSACETAIGDRQSEYGFAGFAVKAGSRSALASLWAVSDEGALGFMTQFYQGLSNNAIRARALRDSQLAMMRGEVGIHYGQLYGLQVEDQAFIPELANSGSWDFSHPYYWSAFTLIGSPW